MMLTMNAIAIQVAKTANTSASDFRNAMAEKWQGLTAKTGATIWGKTCNPFGREGGRGRCSHNISLSSKNNYLREATQRIVQNVSDIDEVIEIETTEDEDE
jgi:hypothetical protein